MVGKLPALILALVVPLLASASVLQSAGSAPAIETVPISTEAKVSVGGRHYDLKLWGAGYRYKKVAFFKAGVYVGELFATAPEKLRRGAGETLDSLGTQKALAMRMTFLRDVDAEKVSNGYKEALEANKVNLDSASLQVFLGAVRAGGSVKKQKTLILVGEFLPDGKEAISYENPAGKLTTVVGEHGLVRSLFSMWLGNTSDDSGLDQFRQALLSYK